MSQDRKMNVLHLWQGASNQSGGGGGLCLYRLHTALMAWGLDSNVLCDKPEEADPRQFKRQTTHPRLEKRLKRITTRLGLNDVHRLSSFDIPRHPAYQNADVINIHGLHSDFISYLALPRLTRNKPTVFTLHDMWGLTGHCTYSYDCRRWETGCGKCPYPDIYRPVQRDATWVEWRLKNWAYRRSRLAVVSPSSWLTDLARRSMLNRFAIEHIPHGVDTEAYRPLESKIARESLGVPLHKKVIMCAASKLDDERKGTGKLLETLKDLPDALKAKVALLLLGRAESVSGQQLGIETIKLGYIEDDGVKAQAYSAADIFLSPTHADNFPLVLLESLACGTPMAAFDVGGIPDVVRPGITGELATLNDYQGLKDKVIDTLENDARRDWMSQRCREIAVKEYNMSLWIERHIELFQGLVSDKTAVTA